MVESNTLKKGIGSCAVANAEMVVVLFVRTLRDQECVGKE